MHNERGIGHLTLPYKIAYRILYSTGLYKYSLCNDLLKLATVPVVRSAPYNI